MFFTTPLIPLHVPSTVVASGHRWRGPAGDAALAALTAHSAAYPVGGEAALSYNEARAPAEKHWVRIRITTKTH